MTDGALELVRSAVFRQVDRAGAPRPFIVGICGSQGSGKTTLCDALARDLSSKGLRTAALSLDDIYLPLQDRAKLARDVHPLLKTRGPPGTHDVQLGLELLNDLVSGRPTKIPRFNKAIDDRASISEWTAVTDAVDVVLFEGWCIGARAENADVLIEPINDLERNEDQGGIWRRYVNEALGALYQDLFLRLDSLILLAAPDFEIVKTWRMQQEHALISSLHSNNLSSSAVLTDVQIARFIQFYERLTRHILSEMPKRADFTVSLDRRRDVIGVVDKIPPHTRQSSG